MLPLANNPKQKVSIIVYEPEIWGLFLRFFLSHSPVVFSWQTKWNFPLRNSNPMIA